MASSRLRASGVALQALFEADLTGHAAAVSLERLLLEEKVAPAVAEHARQLVAGVVGRMADVDRLLERAAPLWPLAQVAAVDRNVLRLAAYQLVIDSARSLPDAVIINEAVELAKRFGSDNSARFVNGVLGTLTRSAPAEPVQAGR
jgi:N utilization substance protein B